MSRPEITVLFVGLNYRYINPTVSLLPTALAQHCRVHFFGPGYVSPEVLARGIAAYADALGRVDFIVATKDVVGEQTAERLNRFLSKYTYSTSSLHVTPACLTDIETFLHRHRDKVAVALLDVDIYAIPQHALDRFLHVGTYFIGWGAGGVDFSGRDGDIGVEEYVQRKRRMGLQLGLYDAFIETHRRNIINVGFFVGDSDFAWGALSGRPLDVSVPGARYYRRQRAHDALKAEKRFRIGGERFRIPFQLADRLKLRPWSRPYGTHLYNHAFHHLLARSKVGVTEGGLINFTIRKFFEIPAAGAVMVCWPTREFDALGFQDGVNCVFVRDEQEVIQAVDAVVRDPDRFQALASAGRDLVLRRHSASARGAQIHRAFEAILAGTFQGAELT